MNENACLMLNFPIMGKGTEEREKGLEDGGREWKK